jgi:Palmitoyl protein thioesterase
LSLVASATAFGNVAWLVDDSAAALLKTLYKDIPEGVEAYSIGIHRLTEALGQPGNKATLIKMGNFKTWQGSNEYDADAGIWGIVNKQLDQVCAAVSNEPELADGFNAVAFSQGGLFFRALIERCSGLIV